MPAFQTALERLAEKWAKRSHYMHTRPQESVVYFVGDVETTLDPAVRILHFAEQTRDAFLYAQKDLVPGLDRPATAADTSLIEAGKTPYGVDMAIEGLTCEFVQALPEFDWPDAFTPPASVNMATGQRNGRWFDPAGIFTPLQLHSPEMRENAIETLLRGAIVTDIKFDNSAEINLGTLAGWPSGGGSMLRAYGTPDYTNRLKISEGFLWMGSDADSRMRIRAQLVMPCSMPIRIRDIENPDASRISFPLKRVRVGFRFKVHGKSFGEPSKN